MIAWDCHEQGPLDTVLSTYTIVLLIIVALWILVNLTILCQGITVKSPRTQYTRDQLLQWNTHNSITGLQSDFQFPDCIHRRDNFNSATGDKPCKVKKSFEKLVKEEIVMQTEQALDPLQFAYRAHRGVNDATITLLNLLYKHLEGSNTHARLLFINFSSAFKTIQPHILAMRLLEHFKLSNNLVGWILGFFN